MELFNIIQSLNTIQFHQRKTIGNIVTNEELELVILKSAEGMTSQRSLADEIGFSVGKINYVLKALVDKGFIKADSFLNSGNKRKYSYLLTDDGIKEKIALTQKFIIRKKAEHAALQMDLESYQGNS